MSWNKIWKQAMTQSLPLKLGVPSRMTLGFPLVSPVSGNRLRITMCNLHGKHAAHIRGVTVKIGKTIYDLTQNGHPEFAIPAGESAVSDPLTVSVNAGDRIEVRFFPVTKANDLNYIEDDAFAFKGDLLHQKELPPATKTPAEIKNNTAKMLPYIEGVELDCGFEAKTIVAFGDSITAMSRWTKPLSDRLTRSYGGEILLLNAGIAGNCLVYQRKGFFKHFFGEKGRDRFERDVLTERNVSSVIVSIGTNDLFYMNGKTAKDITVDQLISAMKETVEKAKARGFRVIATTVMPKYGPKEYTAEKDEPRLTFNRWLRSYDRIDYLLDWDELAKDPENPVCLKEGFHQGDYLHPSYEGGRELAESFDLEKLVMAAGREK